LLKTARNDIIKMAKWENLGCFFPWCIPMQQKHTADQLLQICFYAEKIHQRRTDAPHFTVGLHPNETMVS
jgi:hypothetical protein